MLNKYIVKITTNFPDQNLLRQTPNNSSIWGQYDFHINDDIDECDFWVVYDGLINTETVMCPLNHTVFITGEPPDQRTYPQKYLNQFSKIITCHAKIKHAKVSLTQQALPWHVGWNKSHPADNSVTAIGYDQFKQMSSVKKDKLISVVCSLQHLLPGHQLRLHFLEKLRKHFGDNLDVFGRGIRPVNDKWDAIAPYKYHIVMENSFIANYWTEKLSDAYLGFAFPIYFGCPNIYDYFDSDSLKTININDWKGSIHLIEDVINGGTYENKLSSIIEARNAVLDKYNLFAMLADTFDKQTFVSQKQEITIFPESNYPDLIATMKRKLSRVPSRLNFWIQNNTNRPKS